jgi:hypothetical protein
MQILSAQALTYITSPQERNVEYVVIDKQTRQQVRGPYATRVRASRMVDRLDNEYGGYRYFVQEVSKS